MNALEIFKLTMYTYNVQYTNVSTLCVFLCRKKKSIYFKTISMSVYLTYYLSIFYRNLKSNGRKSDVIQRRYIHLIRFII